MKIIIAATAGIAVGLVIVAVVNVAVDIAAAAIAQRIRFRCNTFTPIITKAGICCCGC